MATASVTYQPVAGRAFVDLTSWAGDAGFATTPVATDQIEGPDTLTLNADGTVTGADGTYTLRHIQAANGTTEAVSYTITTADTTSPTLTSPTATVTGSTTIEASVSTNEANGTLYTLASANATETANTVKTSGQSQAVIATGPQSVSITGLTASSPYYVHFMHEDAATNQSAVATSAQVTTDAAPTASSATATVAYIAPTGKTAVTLATGFDDYIFQEWAAQPVVGEQIVFTDSELTIDELANVTTDTEAVFDIWFVELDGTVTATTIDTTGLASAVDTTPAQFTFTDQTNVEPGSVGESNAITISDVAAGENIPVTITGGEYAVDAGSGFGAFTSTGTNVQLGYQIKVGNTASSSFETAVNTTLAVGGVSDTFTRTTRAAVLPTQDVTLPDLSLGETDAVSIDLDNYFSGASSYTLTGIPADSGLSFSGSVLSGNVNKDDIAASPFTLTATAFSADGSINDAFSVTVVDDIAPAVTIGDLTTLNTTPTAAGSAGDATSLSLVVEGVDVTHTSSYNPTPSNGSWAQQLNELAIGTYTMTLTGADDAGNERVVTATMNVVDEIITSPRGLFQPLFRSLTGSVNQTLFR